MFAIRLVACFAVVLLALTLEAASAEEPPEDPWVGKERSDVVSLLGKPTKTKKSAGGQETLIYKLLHVDPSKESMEAPVIHLPGVGLVAPRRKSMEAPHEAELDTGGWHPTTRLEGSATNTAAGWSVYDATGNLPPSGKLKVRFELDSAGRVVRWHSSK